MDPLFVRTHGRSLRQASWRTSANKLPSPFGGMRASCCTSRMRAEGGTVFSSSSLFYIVILGLVIAIIFAIYRLSFATIKS